MKLKYIITGTGRCGTVYFAKLLTSLGINCGHESIFSCQGLEKAILKLTEEKPQVSLISTLASVSKKEDWFPDGVTNLQADSSYMAAPFLQEDIAKNAKIIHLIRHPLEVINSFVYGLGYFKDNLNLNKYDRDYHEFIYSHVPIILTLKHPLDRAAAFYIWWNRLIEEKSKGKPYIRHNIKRSLSLVFKFLEVKNPSVYYDNTRSNHINGLNNHITGFDQIPTVSISNDLREIYHRYFYIKM